MAGSTNYSVEIKNQTTDVNETTGDGRDKFHIDELTGNITISSGAGKDKITIDDSTGEIILDTGDGNDKVKISDHTGDVEIMSGAGNDSIYVNGLEGNLSVDAGSGRDKIIARDIDGDVDIDADSGNDYIKLNKVDGDVDIEAGDGNDWVFTSHVSGNTNISGGNGSDKIFGSFGDETIQGGAGNDFIFAGWGNDTAIYNAPLNAGSWDFYQGGGGYDELVIEVETAEQKAAIENYWNNLHYKTFVNFSNVGDGFGFDLFAISFEKLTVNLINEAPVAANDNYSIEEDGVLSVNAAEGVLDNDSDADGNPLTAVLETGPTNGSLTLNDDGSFSYTPNANFEGADSFTYRANDGNDNSNLATVNITVNAVNDPPEASDDSYSVDEDNVLTVTAAGVLSNDNDPIEGDPLTAVLETGPTNGSLTLNDDGSFSYTPNANFEGADSFTYRANDGNDNSNLATVNITVNAVNDPPEASDDSYSVDEGDTLTVSAGNGVLSNDNDPIEGDPLTAVLETGPNNGSLTLNDDGSFSYTPNAGFEGADSFTYRANDGADNSNLATVNITVNDLNGAPTVSGPLSVTASERDPEFVFDLLSGASDPDGDMLSISDFMLIGNPGKPPIDRGITVNNDGTLTVNPFSYGDLKGDASVTINYSYIIEDPDGAFVNQTASITITGVDGSPPKDGGAPTANDDSYSVDEDNDLLVLITESVLENDTDPDGDSLSATLVSGPSNGTLNLTSFGTFLYTPDANFNGEDTPCSTFPWCNCP